MTIRDYLRAGVVLPSAVAGLQPRAAWSATVLSISGSVGPILNGGSVFQVVAQRLQREAGVVTGPVRKLLVTVGGLPNIQSGRRTICKAMPAIAWT